MDNNNGSLSFSAAIDNSQLKRDVEEIKRMLAGMAGSVEDMGSRMDGALGMVGKAIAGAFSVQKLKEFVTEVANVRGQFQQLEVAFSTMLGSAEKADALMEQLTVTAATTPFDLQGVANGAKQLLAYGESAENVNDDLIRLGNIAAGLSQPLNDLVYLYGTTMTQGRLYTQDLNQFTGRGIPMIRELATVLGVAEDSVKDMVEAGKVGFPEVQQAIRNMTDEGGTFYNLMEEQSKTITGRIGNIEDAIETMFNEIGKQSEGIIGGALDVVSSLVENYERVGRTLLGLVGTYGTYRAAVMAVAAAHSLQAAGIAALTAAEAAHYGWLVLVKKAQELLNKTMLTNPYVLAATAIAGLVAAMASMKTETERLKEAEEEYQAAKQKAIEAEEEHRRRLEELCSVAGDESLATDTRREALYKLEQEYPDIFDKYDTEYEKLKNIKQIKEEIARLEAEQSVTRAENELEAVEERIRELEAKGEKRVPVTYTTSAGTGMTMWKSGLSDKEAAELRNLRSKREELSEKVRKEQAEAYFKDLTGISNEELEELIRQRENLLAKMKVVQADKGTITNGPEGLRGTYTRGELTAQKDMLKAELDRRNARTDSSTGWAEQARKEYEEALKEYNDFMADTSNSLTQEDYEKKAKELKEAVDAAKKEYDKYGASGGTGTESEEKEREDAERKAADSLLALQKQNQQQGIDLLEEGTAKRLAQIDADYEARKAEIEKKEAELKELNEKAGTADTNENGLTQEQQAGIDEANRLNEEGREQQVREAYDEEISAMRSYLEQYGTFQQQKLAIAQEYAEKISKAQTEGERLSLEKERDSRLAGVETQALKSEIDWQAVFGGFGGMFEDIVKPVLEEAKAYMQSDEFKNADQSSQQALVETVRQMESSVGSADTVSFSKLGQEVKEYQAAMSRLTDAQDEYKVAFDVLTSSQEADNDALATGTKEEQEAAKSMLDTAEKEEQAAAENVEAMKEAADGAKQTMTGTATTLKTSMEGVVSGLQQLSSGSLSGAFNGLKELGNSAEKMGGTLGKALGKMSDSLESVDIVGDILSILDVLKDGIGGLLSDLVDTALGTVDGILEDVLSGGIVTKVATSAAEGVSNILDTISFGGFSSLLGWGESDPDLEKRIELLTNSNEVLERAIDNLADKLDEVALEDATGVYEDQVAKLEEAMSNTQRMMLDSAEAYKGGFGGTHSSSSKINDAMSDDEWARISEIVGESVKGAKDFFSLSSEEMSKVADEAPDLYGKIKTYADDGYKDAAQYMDEYIEYYEELEELTDAYYEKLTGVSFDSLSDSFKDTLMDMDASAEDFADDLTETMFNALVEGMMAGKYSERLEDWYEDFAAAMEDGTLTDEEMAELREAYGDIAEAALAERDALAEATGYDELSERSGTTGGITTASQETVDELNARATTIQSHTYTINENTKLLVTNTNLILQSVLNIEGNTDGLSARMENVESYAKETRDTVNDIALRGIKVRT